jgi:hypothetical protein
MRSDCGEAHLEWRICGQMRQSREYVLIFDFDFFDTEARWKGL